MTSTAANFTMRLWLGFPLIVFVGCKTTAFAFSHHASGNTRHVSFYGNARQLMAAKGQSSMDNVNDSSQNDDDNTSVQENDDDDSTTNETTSGGDGAVVTLKMAFDQQWGVADMSETKSERFTCPASLDMVHRLRRVSDCVLVGRGTVERDDCTLTVRRVPLLQERPNQPARVVVDPQLTLLRQEQSNVDNNDGLYKIFHDGQRTIVYHGIPSDDEWLNSLTTNEHVVCVSLPLLPGSVSSSSSSTLDVSAMLKDMKENRGIDNVMLEGGPATARAFLAKGLVDRAVLVRAPMTFQEPYDSELSNRAFKDAGLEPLGSYPCGDDHIDCWSRPGLPWPESNLADWP